MLTAALSACVACDLNEALTCSCEATVKQLHVAAAALSACVACDLKH